MKENFAISPIVTGLQSYVKENRDEIIARLNLSASSVPYFGRIQTGVKKSAYLNLLQTDPELVEAGCTHPNGSSVDLANKLLEVANLSFGLDWCSKSLIGKQLEWKIRVNAGYRDIPFEDQIIRDITEKVARKNDLLIWQGSKVAGTGYLGLTDGIKTQLANDASVIRVAYVATDTAVEQVSKTILTIPAEIYNSTQTVRIFCSPEFQRAYIQEVISANMFHIDVTAERNDFSTYRIPGTPVILTAVAGLQGADVLITTYEDNLVLGVDMMGDSEDIDVWYSNDDRLAKMQADYNLGATVVFPEHCVYTELA